MRNYTIGEIAKIVEIPAKTIRFYEEEGVLKAPTRSKNGYRVYTEELVEELKMLKYTRDLGLPLTEIKKLLRGCEGDHCEHPHEYIESLITGYINNLNEKMKEMETLKIKLKSFKKQVESGCEGENLYCCNILHQITKGGEGNGR
jgi:DNA-binding transcriptional MerR regulator